ncbi:hypothetical protein BH09ACT7_BH09ACT7_40930 [soil metagenome]
MDSNQVRGIVPYHHLDRSAIRATLGQGGSKGTRAVAAYDEDSTSMGAEAARRALWGAPPPESLYFATTAPAYADKTNATASHADLGASVRGAVRGAARGGGHRRDGRAVRHPHEASRLRRLGNRRGRGRGIRFRLRRPGDRRDRCPGVGLRGVSGPLAGARRVLQPSLGGALRYPGPPAFDHR